MINQTKTRDPLLIELNERYIVNTVGERVEVILPINAFEQLLAELSELRDRENLKAEMDAWDRASDEALVNFEKELT